MAQLKTTNVHGDLHVSGDITQEGNKVYHEGNFNPNAKANTSTQVIAGNGLSGGGTLAANRTLALGTPSTITNDTTNSVTATSHTHALTVTKADVGLSDVTNVAQAAAATQIIAGTGLTGGGTLAANRTLNVSYGTTSGTSAQGNDSRIVNGQTAYGWGNHASAGYVKTDTKYSAGNGLTLSGTTFSLPVTVSGSGSYVQSVAQNANGITVTLGTPPNTNTTYSTMSVAELMAGTVTTARTMSAKNIDDFTTFVALSGTSVTPNLNSGRNFTLSLAGNTTINNPTNLRSGQTGDIAITVGATEHTLSFGSAWKFAGGNVPETKANSITVISYKVVDASTIICGVGTEVK